jgi:DNA modification methylase
MTVNKRILGDNLEILKGVETDSVDLVYLDPPFFSNRNYKVIWEIGYVAILQKYGRIEL